MQNGVLSINNYRIKQNTENEYDYIPIPEIASGWSLCQKIDSFPFCPINNY